VVISPKIITIPVLVEVSDEGEYEFTTGSQKHTTSNLRIGIFSQASIQHSVRNLIAKLILEKLMMCHRKL
jgi:hypothetical protein